MAVDPPRPHRSFDADGDRRPDASPFVRERLGDRGVSPEINPIPWEDHHMKLRRRLFVRLAAAAIGAAALVPLGATAAHAATNAPSSPDAQCITVTVYVFGQPTTILVCT
jgi:hypothetical protein